MDVMSAAFNVAEDYPGGVSGLARAIDKNPTTLSHEVKETGGAKLGIKTAVKITSRSGDLRILHAFASAVGQMCVPLPGTLEVDSDECMRALGRASSEFADLAREICVSLGDDGEVSANELSRIEREGGELVAAVHNVIRAARGRHLAYRAGGDETAFPAVT